MYPLTVHLLQNTLKIGRQIHRHVETYELVQIPRSFHFIQIRRGIISIKILNRIVSDNVITELNMICFVQKQSNWIYISIFKGNMPFMLYKINKTSGHFSGVSVRNAYCQLLITMWVMLTVYYPLQSTIVSNTQCYIF